MKQTIIVSLIVGLLALSGGYFLGQSKLNLSQSVNRSGANASSNSDVKINSLSGAVKAVNDSKITLEINNSDERIVEIDNQTKVYILEQKDPAQYKKEMEEYFKKIQEQKDSQSRFPDALTAPINSVLSPEVFAKKIGSIADIKSGIILTVVVAGQDIKNVKQFKATQIIIPPPPVSSTSIPPIVPLSNQ